MDEKQKISISVHTKDGSAITRNFTLDDDGIQNKNWAEAISDMVETLEESYRAIN